MLCAELPKRPLAVRETVVEHDGKKWKRVSARYHPVGADVVRWFYCRANPASNVNFGPEPVQLPPGHDVLISSNDLDGGAVAQDTTVWLRPHQLKGVGR